jgi:threonine dehydrogenase-like Zn-dependent dehydrogenase
MRALQVRRNVAKLGIARIASAVSPTMAAKMGPLDLRWIDDPSCPGGTNTAGWHQVKTRLAGICGSDISLVEGHASTYFEDWVSFPFVPGHEVVGELESGQRVILEPVLGHAARGLPLPFEGASPADGDDYAHLAMNSNGGALEAGIQTGFCCSTGGGWAPWFWAHDSQLHHIDDSMPDERAVLVEPLAGGIHAALLSLPSLAGIENPVVAVLGAGTMGLAAIAGLKRYVPEARIVVGARYPHQQAFAKALGADVVVPDSQMQSAVRRQVGGMVVGGQLTSGAHVTIDAVGSNSSVVDALAMTKPRGRVVLLGMPADVTLDLTGLWHRETELKGAYTYGTETLADGSTAKTFDLAVDTANHFEAERLLSATYPLADHVDAIAHAATAGRRGAVKIAFDLRTGDS